MLIPLKYKLFLFGFLFPLTVVLAQNGNEDLYVIENRVLVDSSLERAWSVLSDFAGVGDILALYEESNALGGGSGDAYKGAERKSYMPNGNYNIILTERITEFEELSSYTYEVTEWENISLAHMAVTFGVRIDESGNTVLYSKTAYRMSNAILTSLYKTRFGRNSKDNLIAYKYFIETGVSEKDLRKLRKWYKENQKNASGDAFLLSSLDH